MGNSLQQLILDLEKCVEEKTLLNNQLIISQKRIADLHNQIIHLATGKADKSQYNQTIHYNRSAGNPSKVFKILEIHRVCLTQRELWSLIQVYDNVELSELKKLRLKTLVKSALDYWTKKGDLKQFIPLNSKDPVFGLQEWFDSNGLLVDGYDT
jgi:hypothetical protein